MTQASMFDTRQASHEAAESVRPLTGEMRKRVLERIRRHAWEGCTCDELEVWLDMPHQTASARVNELMKMGLIVASGKRRTRSGRNACVWVMA